MKYLNDTASYTENTQKINQVKSTIGDGIMKKVLMGTIVYLILKLR